MHGDGSLRWLKQIPARETQHENAFLDSCWSCLGTGPHSASARAISRRRAVRSVSFALAPKAGTRGNQNGALMVALFTLQPASFRVLGRHAARANLRRASHLPA